MKTLDFTTSILVHQSPKQVFDAISNPQDWWPGEIIGSAKKLNDEFSYRYEEFHLTRQQVVEMIPDQKVVWLVTESQINYAEDINEWTGTKIIFEISEEGNKTRLCFTHQGLVPEIECFDSCSNSWSQIIQQSLFSLITTGEGKKIVLA
ncbi:MAG TPA: SRPBCC domain-containing protein [Pedobacter sp.]|uniref:SRPBCC family protein n=1 Tax=Pedobacter sp. TaxID=1411316 RepID=UPI002C25239A|nr:SRPBCC domain-containing protein [Pedobacter sp.]HMI02053.1 SRPBCC domain-containing protein [Pedobacter sp.]